jgi:c-di-GMP-binding flagellar brake protein YcgR
MQEQRDQLIRMRSKALRIIDETQQLITDMESFNDNNVHVVNGSADPIPIDPAMRIRVLKHRRLVSQIDERLRRLEEIDAQT